MEETSEEWPKTFFLINELPRSKGTKYQIKNACLTLT